MSIFSIIYKVKSFNGPIQDADRFVVMDIFRWIFSVNYDLLSKLWTVRYKLQICEISFDYSGTISCHETNHIKPHVSALFSSSNVGWTYFLLGLFPEQKRSNWVNLCVCIMYFSYKTENSIYTEQLCCRPYPDTYFYWCSVFIWLPFIKLLLKLPADILRYYNGKVAFF